MATKSKKFSYSVFSKILCFSLSCVFLFIATANAASLAVNIERDESLYVDAVTRSDNSSIYTTYSFSKLCEKHLSDVMLKSLFFKDGSKETFMKTAKDIIDKAFQEKLRYCMSTHADDLENTAYASLEYICDGYFDYSDGSGNHYRKSSSDSVVEVPKGADRIYFSDGKIYAVTFDKKLMYEYVANEIFIEFTRFFNDNENALKGVQNLKYVVLNKTDKTFYSNVSQINKSSDASEIKKLFSAYEWRFYTNSSGKSDFSEKLVSISQGDYNSITFSPLTQNEIVSTVEDAVSRFSELPYSGTLISKDEYELYVAFDEKVPLDDEYKDIFENISSASKEIKTKVAIFAVTGLLVLISLVYLTVTAGRKEKGGEVELVFVDRFFTGLHLIITLIVMLLCMLISKEIAVELMEIGVSDWFDKVLPYLLALPVLVAYAAFTQWLMSFSRNVKNRTLLKHTLAGYLFFNEKFPGTKTGRKRRSIFLAIFILYIVLTIVFSVMLDEYFEAIIPLLMMILIGAAFVLISAFYLSKITNATDADFQNQDEKNIDARVFPVWLRPLASNISQMQKNTNEAIESAIKDQKMKTQLITNVSHDLKTPLTAVINYSDLLSKCDIQNEQAREYVAVISEKSERLKKLIEDLTEAAKASSGNIQATILDLNLNEVAVQTAGENEDLLNSKKLEIVLKLPDKPVIVAADSKLTCRVLENLMSNVQKYAMPGSRVYITVNTDKAISISNVSEKPLDISPEELKARFVRGDESRTTEGSGLGLAIADDLCKIQGARLDISIDGDLFKATVIFEAEKLQQ